MREDHQFVYSTKESFSDESKKQVPLLTERVEELKFSLTDITINNAHNRVTVRPVTHDNLGRHFDCLSAYAISFQSAFFFFFFVCLQYKHSKYAYR